MSMFDQLVPELRKPPAPKPPVRKTRFPRVVNPFGLSPTECEVFRLLCEGMDQEQASQAMGIARKSVATYVHRVKQKMGALSTTHACLIWDRWARSAPTLAEYLQRGSLHAVEKPGVAPTRST